MERSIKSQLQSIAAARKAIPDYRKGFREASLIFPKKSAAKIDDETVYKLAVSGLQDLVRLNSEFSDFGKTLFSERRRSIERSDLNMEENQEISREVSDFLTLLSPYLMTMYAQRCVEYLIRRYEVHRYDPEEMILCAMPHHDTGVFAKIVSMIKLRGTRWEFLEPVKRSRKPIEREVLSKKCIDTRWLLSKILSNFKKRLLMFYPLRTFHIDREISFIFALIFDIIDISLENFIRTDFENIVNIVFPYLLIGLEMEKMNSYKMAALALVAKIYSIDGFGTPFSVLWKVVETVVLTEIRSNPPADRNTLLFLISIYKTQNLKRFPSLVDNTEREFIVDFSALDKLSAEYDTSKFLDAYVHKLVEQSDASVFGPRILSQMPEGGFGRTISDALAKFFLGDLKREDIKYVQEILSTIDAEYPEIVDEYVTRYGKGERAWLFEVFSSTHFFQDGESSFSSLQKAGKDGGDPSVVAPIVMEVFKKVSSLDPSKDRKELASIKKLYSSTIKKLMADDSILESVLSFDMDMYKMLDRDWLVGFLLETLDRFKDLQSLDKTRAVIVERSLKILIENLEYVDDSDRLVVLILSYMYGDSDRDEIRRTVVEAVQRHYLVFITEGVSRMDGNFGYLDAVRSFAAGLFAFFRKDREFLGHLIKQSNTGGSTQFLIDILYESLRSGMPALDSCSWFLSAVLESVDALMKKGSMASAVNEIIKGLSKVILDIVDRVGMHEAVSLGLGRNLDELFVFQMRYFEKISRDFLKIVFDRRSAALRMMSRGSLDKDRAYPDELLRMFYRFTFVHSGGVPDVVKLRVIRLAIACVQKFGLSDVSFKTIDKFVLYSVFEMVRTDGAVLFKPLYGFLLNVKNKLERAPVDIRTRYLLNSVCSDFDSFYRDPRGFLDNVMAKRDSEDYSKFISYLVHLATESALGDREMLDLLEMLGTNFFSFLDTHDKFLSMMSDSFSFIRSRGDDLMRRLREMNIKEGLFYVLFENYVLHYQNDAVFEIFVEIFESENLNVVSYGVRLFEKHYKLFDMDVLSKLVVYMAKSAISLRNRMYFRVTSGRVASDKENTEFLVSLNTRIEEVVALVVSETGGDIELFVLDPASAEEWMGLSRIIETVINHQCLFGNEMFMHQLLNLYRYAVDNKDGMLRAGFSAVEYFKQLCLTYVEKSCSNEWDVPPKLSPDLSDIVVSAGSVFEDAPNTGSSLMDAIVALSSKYPDAVLAGFKEFFLNIAKQQLSEFSLEKVNATLLRLIPNLRDLSGFDINELVESILGGSGTGSLMSATTLRILVDSSGAEKNVPGVIIVCLNTDNCSKTLVFELLKTFDARIQLTSIVEVLKYAKFGKPTVRARLVEFLGELLRARIVQSSLLEVEDISEYDSFISDVFVQFFYTFDDVEDVDTERLNDILSMLEEMMNLPTYFESVSRLLRGDPMSSKSYIRVLNRLSDKLYATTEQAINVPEISRLLERMVLDLVNRILSSDSHGLLVKQMAVICLDPIFEKCGNDFLLEEEGIELAEKVMPLLISGLVREADESVEQMGFVSSVILLISTIIKQFRDGRVLASFPKVFQFVLKTFFSTIKGKTVLGEMDALVVRSCLECIQSSVDTIPEYISTYVGKILTVLLTLAKLEITEGMRNKLLGLLNLLSLKVEFRHTLKYILETYKYAMVNGPKSLHVLLHFLQHVIDGISLEEGQKYSATISKLFLVSFDIRNNQNVLHASPEDLRILEGKLVDAFTTYTLRVNETIFKPVFIKFVNWSLPADEWTDVEVNKSIIFFKLCETLAVKLRSIFTPYIEYIEPGVLSYLQQVSKERRYSGELISHIMGFLYNLFKMDSESYIDHKRYETYIDVLVDLIDLGVDLGGRFVGVIGQMVASMADEGLWKNLNYKILLKTRTDSVKVKMLILNIIKEIYDRVGEEFLVLLPDTVPFLAELLEETDSVLEEKVMKVVEYIESFLSEGKSLKDFF